MKQKITTIIRVILSIIMIYFIYGETGIFTTIFASLVTIYIELNSANWRKVVKGFDAMSDYMDSNTEIHKHNLRQNTDENPSH